MSGSAIHNLWDAFFFTTVQLLTVSSQMPNPLTTGGRIVDIAPFLPVPQAAKLLGISRASAYRLAATGELPSRRLGGRIYIVTAELRLLVAA